MEEMTRQTTIMATQTALSKETNQLAAISSLPRIIVNANSPESTNNIVLVFTNLGNSSAYNVVIFASAMWRAPQANFDPFKSTGGTKLPPQTIDELPPSTTAGSTFAFTKPLKGEGIYVYGTYSYETEIPEFPKTSRQFCYLARDNGIVEPCRTFHVVSLNASVSATASDIGATITVIPPAPNPVPSASAVGESKKQKQP